MEGLFHEADMSWIPQLIDILAKADSTNPDTEERAYYAKFGIAAIDRTGYIKLNAIWSDVTQVFNERYLTRRIGRETLELWQGRLQWTFDDKAAMYERMLTLYDTYEDAMDDNILEGYKDTDQHGSIDGGSDTLTGSSRSIDTPDQILNANDNYADSLTKSTTANQYGRTNNTSGTATHTVNGPSVIDDINAAARNKVCVTDALVAEFENCFLNVLWY